MKKKILKRFLILSVSLLLICITGVILACAGGDFEDFYTSFFAPETSGITVENQFFRSNNKFYGSERFEDAVHSFDSANLVEWHRFFNGVVGSNDLRYLVYTARIGEIDSLIFYLKDTKYPAKYYLKKNSINLVADKSLAKEFLFYLGFAKRCEPYSTYSPSWWDDNAGNNDPRKDIPSLEKLTVGGKKVVVNVKSEFIRQRYLFQLIRLAYNSEAYEECIARFLEQEDVLSSAKSIKYRSMGYAAGAYYKLKKYNEANYLYAKIFDQCTEMKTVAFLSFHPQEENDWNQSLSLAKNQREKESLWQLLGIYADPFRAMKAIYQINPKSDKLDLLLVRAINIQEEEFIPGISYWSEKTDSGYALKTTHISKDFASFLYKTADLKNTNKPYLWDLTAGYLAIVSHDFKSADKYLKNASREITGNTLVAEQIRLFRIINTIEQYTRPTSKTEAELAVELNWLDKEKHDSNLRSTQTLQWIQKRIAAIYAKNGDQIMAQCFDYSQNMAFYNDPEKLKAMVVLMDKPNKTAFEKYALTVHPYSRNDIFEFEAVNLIYQYKFRDALAKFDASKGSGDQILYGDPFIIHINDCHDCDHAAEQSVKYTKYTFVKRLAELTEATPGNAKAAAENNFLLANGLYNMTYFGNARVVYDTKIKISLPADSYDVKLSVADPAEDCLKAETYYRKAIYLAPDKESKAKYCFMAAKCEQNRAYVSSGTDNSLSYKPGEYFKQLKTEFSKTRYYQEILQECGYFHHYASR